MPSRTIAECKTCGGEIFPTGATREDGSKDWMHQEGGNHPAEPDPRTIQREDTYPDLRQRPQRQDSTTEQMKDVIVLATRAGCYDAADVLKYKYLPEEQHA